MYLSFIKTFLFTIILQAALAQSPAATPVWGNWQNWGDQGNGYYRNPILPADYSDLHCTRVGDDYYAVSSTLQYSPGFIILHSRDLVNWAVLSHAMRDIIPVTPQINWYKMTLSGTAARS